jgi:hypothetical protein
MRLSQFIIALLFIVAAGLATFSFIIPLLEDGYNVDLSNDTSTAKISQIQSNLTKSRGDLGRTTQSVFNGSVGQPGADIKSGQITEGDLIAASGRAITNIPTYLQTFFNLLIAIANALGLGNIPALWWLFTSMIIIIALLAIGIFVKQVL